MSASPPRPGLHEEKLAWAKAHGGARLPSNVAWFEGLDAEAQDRARATPRRKPTRTLSGVAVVAVMTSPAHCPHGRCTYCPGGVEFRAPQSYTGEEPSALRGAQFGWDARAITEHRLGALETIGHPTSKVEVIVMGGTFPARPVAYQEAVLRGIFDGLNGASSPTLEAAHTRNELADRRCVGLTVETRPDQCDGPIVDRLLAAGVTRVEIGVECLQDDVLLAVGRAHGVDSVRAATRNARARGLKVAYHLMLGLPGMNPERDLADFERLWSDPAYRPDMLKIYPTLVIPGTALHDDWKAGRYAPYEVEPAVDLLARMKEILPPWVRIQRIQRDIPARLIAAGVRQGNIRELAWAKLADRGRRCPCLRCREVGRRATPAAEDLQATRRSYSVPGAVEHFLSFEEPVTEAVGAFLRLRVPTDPQEGDLTLPIIRELKALGPELPVGTAAPSGGYQHRGFGRRLVGQAAEIAGDAGFRALHVTSAVGTRAYYRRLGFERVGPYLSLRLPAQLPSTVPDPPDGVPSG